MDEPERQRARTRSPRRSVTRLARRAAAKKSCLIIKDSLNDLPDPTGAPLRAEKSRAGHRGLRGERARRRRARVARAAPLTASFEPVCTSSATQLRQSTPDSRPPARTTTLDSHLASSLTLGDDGDPDHHQPASRRSRPAPSTGRAQHAPSLVLRPPPRLGRLQPGPRPRPPRSRPLDRPSPASHQACPGAHLLLTRTRTRSTADPAAPLQATPRPACSSCGTNPLRPFLCVACGTLSCGRLADPGHAHHHALHTQHHLGPSPSRFFAPRAEPAPKWGETLTCARGLHLQRGTSGRARCTASSAQGTCGTRSSTATPPRSASSSPTVGPRATLNEVRFLSLFPHDRLGPYADALLPAATKRKRVTMQKWELVAPVPASSGSGPLTGASPLSAPPRPARILTQSLLAARGIRNLGNRCARLSLSPSSPPRADPVAPHLAAAT